MKKSCNTCTDRYQCTPGIRAMQAEMADTVYCDVYTELKNPDLSKCPRCGGPADNGHDRCVPPSPYLCTKCQAEQESENYRRKQQEPQLPDEIKKYTYRDEINGDAIWSNREAINSIIQYLRVKLQRRSERNDMD